MNNCGIEKAEDIPHRGGGTQTRSLTVQKNEKITRTIPILKWAGSGFLLAKSFKKIFFYYFINAIISVYVVVYIDIWHIVTFCYILMCFSLLLKSTLFTTPNVSPPTVFDLGG